MHRAGAALGVVAALLGAGEMDALAQRVQQGGAGIEVAQPVLLAVDAQSDLVGAIQSGGFFRRGRDRGRRLNQRSRAGKKAGGSEARKERAAAEAALGLLRG